MADRVQSSVLEQILVFWIAVDDFDVLIDCGGMISQALQGGDEATAQTGYALVAPGGGQGSTVHFGNPGGVEIAELLIFTGAGVGGGHGAEVICVEGLGGQQLREKVAGLRVLTRNQ